MIGREDLQALRIPLIALIATLLAALIMIWYSGNVLESSERTRMQREGQLRDARSRILNAGEEKQMIGQYLAGYQSLAKAGFVGEEQRINWLDGLRLTNQQADLFGVDYDISSQKAYPYAADLNPGDIRLNQSMMKLRFRLLHEDDLMRFLNTLSRQGAGIYTVDQCSMKRLDIGTALRYQPNVTAECELAWITAKVAAQAQGEQKK